MKVIKRICDVIDLVNDWIGRIASFAVLGILAVIVTEVVLRRLFHSPQIWTMDVICMTFGCYIIMVCAYGFQKKAFVAVDVLYARLKPLAQNILHLITYLVFFVPFVFVLVPESFGFFLRSYTTGERGYSVWAPPAWPVKLALFVGMTLLALQGISEMLKCVRGIGEAVSGTDDTKEATLHDGNADQSCHAVRRERNTAQRDPAWRTVPYHDHRSCDRSGACVRPRRRRCYYRLSRLGRRASPSP